MPHQTGKDVAAVVNDIHEALSKQTGVSVENVAKIANHLGLEQAVQNRLSNLGTTSDTRQEAISIDTVRISLSPGPPI